MKLSQLTQEFVNDIFQILRHVHDSHWKPPRAAEIIAQLHAEDVYEFKAGSMEKRMWTCRLTIAKDMNENLSIAYHLNPDLPRAMREKQLKMKIEFERKLMETLARMKLA